MALDGNTVVVLVDKWIDGDGWKHVDPTLVEWMGMDGDSSLGTRLDCVTQLGCMEAR